MIFLYVYEIYLMYHVNYRKRLFQRKTPKVIKDLCFLCKFTLAFLMVINIFLKYIYLHRSFKIFSAGTISGEEIPVVSKVNIKEYRDSFSCEKFNFRSNPNITFYVYVSNFSWPIKIQVSDCFALLETFLFQLYIEFHYVIYAVSIQIELFACCIFCV